MPRKFERAMGNRRRHRTPEEKLAKYAVRAEGYEFIPALMHLLKRYVSDVPDRSQNEMDRRMADALGGLPQAKKIFAAAVKNHETIPRETRRGVFSPRYLDLKVEQGIDVDEAAGIVRRTRLLRNRSLADIIATVGSRGQVVREPKDGCCCPPDTPPDRPDPPQPVPRNPYEITFAKLYCVDESDPEWAGSDEPYCVFGVITEEMAESGTPAWGFHTPVYEDVDDGDTRPSSGDQNLRLYGFTGPKPIESSVLVTATCFEHDLGDVSDTTDAIRSALTAVATKAASAGGTAGWLVAGAAAIGIGVTYLVDLIGADDQINSSLTLALTQADADARTAAVNPSLFAPLHFNGGDDDGIYDAYLKLRRA
jgi:hypothetical protein